jgi:peptidoglycan L-alanyl-D-glutamate endopeptidase CwlK
VQEQDALYAQGRNAPGKIVTYAKGGSSYHNYGLAFDIALATQGGVSWDTKADINDNPIPDFFEVGKIGEECGLEWGGRWRGKKQDLPHFQFTFGLTIPELFDGKLPPEE